MRIEAMLPKPIYKKDEDAFTLFELWATMYLVLLSRYWFTEILLFIREI